MCAEKKLIENCSNRTISPCNIFKLRKKRTLCSKCIIIVPIFENHPLSSWIRPNCILMYSITRNFTFFMRNFISRSNISTNHFALHQISTNYFASHFHKLFCFVKIHDALSTTKLTNDSKQESLASRNQNHSRNFLAAQKELTFSIPLTCRVY